MPLKKNIQIKESKKPLKEKIHSPINKKTSLSNLDINLIDLDKIK